MWESLSEGWPSQAKLSQWSRWLNPLPLPASRPCQLWCFTSTNLDTSSSSGSSSSSSSPISFALALICPVALTVQVDISSCKLCGAAVVPRAAGEGYEFPTLVMENGTHIKGNCCSPLSVDSATYLGGNA